MEAWLLPVTVTCQTLLAGSLVATIARPRWRVWPPPSSRSWQFAFTWVLTAVSFLGTVVVGAAHWNACALPSTFRLGLGLPLLLGGIGFSFWALRTLSVHASLGLRGQLIQHGPYRHTRNPQYVGTVACLLGWAVLTSSVASATACLGCAAWYVLAPFAEEPWLRDRFGPPYERYCVVIPRFLSLRTAARQGRRLTRCCSGPGNTAR